MADLSKHTCGQYVLGSFKSLVFPISVDEDITHELYKGKTRAFVCEWVGVYILLV